MCVYTNYSYVKREPDLRFILMSGYRTAQNLIIAVFVQYDAQLRLDSFRCAVIYCVRPNARERLVQAC